VSQNHDDIAARLRDEASATAPERLRADVMLRVRAEPHPQRIRPHRSFGRSFATVAVAACILGALVFGLSRVDFGGGSSSGAGATAGPERSQALGVAGGGTPSYLAPSTSAKRAVYGADGQAVRPGHVDKALTAVPRPLKAAIYGRYQLAAPLRKAFGAIDPHHGPNRR